MKFINWNWNPFKNSKKQIYKPFSFFAFGSSVEFKQIYKASQDNDLLIEYFNNVAEVAAPPLKYSDGAAQITLDTKNEEVKKLLTKPNYYQGFNEFFSLLVLYKRLFGEAIVDAFTQLKIGESAKPQSLFLFSPQYTSIQTAKEKDFRFNIIENYIYDPAELDKNAIIVTPDKILHLKESNPNFINNQYLFGESRYAGCYRNIESIIEGYGAKVNLYKNGPQFIITGKSQGEFAAMGKSEDIDVVKKAMSKYGVGDGLMRNIITDVPLDVKNASLNVAQMQILQNNQSDFQRLCDAQGIDAKVFSETTTFTNKEAALREFYNNSFRSEIDSIVNDLQTFLQRWWPNLNDLKPNYSQISEIVQANNQENERLLKDAEKGLITRNEYLLGIGKEERTEPEFNELFFLTSSGWTPLVIAEANATQNIKGNGTETVETVQVNS
jgi:hypothetical protein